MTNAIEMPSRRAAVYRYWDAEGNLLYIGSAYDPDTRARRHMDKPWWPLVVRRTDEWCEHRGVAYRAEMKAIAEERPTYNDFGKPGYRTPQTPAVLRRAEGMRERGRVESEAWAIRRRVLKDELEDGAESAEAHRLAEEARIAHLEASGLFPGLVERRRAASQ